MIEFGLKKVFYTIYYSLKFLNTIIDSLKSKKPIICFSYVDGTYSDFYINIYRELVSRPEGYKILLLFNPVPSTFFDRRFKFKHFAPSPIIYLLKKYVIITASGLKSNKAQSGKTIIILHGFGSIGSGFQEDFIIGYDKIFLTMPYQYEQLSTGEYRHLVKEENLTKIGYPRIDGEILPITKKQRNKGKVVFYGPTYHVEISSIFEFLLPIVEYTNKNKMILLIKLHPFLYNKDDFNHSGKKDWASLIDKLSMKYNNIFLLKRNTPFNQVRKYFKNTDFFITDTSGIGFEYSLITGRPTVFLGNKLKIPLADLRKNKLGKYYDCPEIKNRNIIGPVIETPEVLEEELDFFTKNYSNYLDPLAEFRKGFTYNLGNASLVAADEIINLLNE